MRTYRTSHLLRAVLAGLLGLALISCVPTPAPTGTIKITVKLDGQPVAADGSALTKAGGGAVEQFTTGSSGTATVSGAAGSWQVSANGPFVPTPSDPLCGQQATASKSVTVVAGRSTKVVLNLQPDGQLICQ